MSLRRDGMPLAQLAAAALQTVPTAISQREADCLARHARDKRVVEAGALLGASTITLARTAVHVVSIDRHMGYTGDTWAAYLSNLDRAGVRLRVTAIRGEAIAQLPKHDADMAFIDLTGEYGLTLSAINATTAPLIAIHDYQRVRCEGVARAIKTAGLRLVEVVDSLAVAIRVGSLALAIMVAVGCDKLVSEERIGTVEGPKVIHCEKLGFCYGCSPNFKGEYSCGYGIHFDCEGKQNATVRTTTYERTYESGKVYTSDETETIALLGPCQ